MRIAQEQNSIEFVIRAKAEVTAFLKALNPKFKEIPDPYLVGVISGEHHESEVCASMEVHMAFEEISQDFLSIGLFDLHRHLPVIKGEREVQFLGNGRGKCEL